MSANNLDDADYPYASHAPAVLSPVELLPPRVRRWAGHLIWIWMVRLSLAAAVAIAIVALPVGIVGYRAGRQGAMVAELERRGCDVHFSYVPAADKFLEFLTETFGKKYFGEVTFVTATRLS